jgi:hypothetical protein
MERLPRVLQNEIWEYVRGDRGHWKGLFSQQVIDEIERKNHKMDGGTVVILGGTGSGKRQPS